MIWRALFVWSAVLALAALNGAAREAWLVPRLGEVGGRVISTLILCVLVLVTWLTIGWIHPTSAGEAMGTEFLAGHYAFGKDWAVQLEDFDLSRGRIWVAVLIVVLLAPLWTARMRGLLSTLAVG